MIPEDIIISGKYTWISPRGEFFIIGLNEQIIIDGEAICTVELPEVGDEIEEGNYFVTVETANGLIEVYAPVSGEVVEVNEDLIINGEVINEDPYGTGLVVVETDEEWELE